MDTEKVQSIASTLKVDVDRIGAIYLESIEWCSKFETINK